MAERGQTEGGAANRKGLLHSDLCICKWIVVIGGFTQDAHRPTGVETLWLKLRRFAGPYVSLQLREWNDDFEGLAERIWRLKPDGLEPDVRINAYSWGAGHGAIELSEQLGQRGISVTKMVLCDPVYHSWVAPWRAVWSLVEPRITIPANVREVWSLRQEVNRPRGHDVKTSNADTVVHAPKVLKRAHQWMDDAPDWHSLAVEAAQ